MEDAIICPACGFDPYDMIIYAAKQEFPDRNPRDVIEEMYKSGDYDVEADFYVFENHPEFCPNQELLMDYIASLDIPLASEEEAYAYAYNDGHSESRKNEPYKPNPTIKEGANFKKIYKQRAESADKKFCSNCSQEEEEDGYEISTCTDCYDDFCEKCFCSDCETCDDDCLCKCVECGDKDRYMYDLADGGNVCEDCSSRCDECEKRFPRDEVEGNNINHKDYCEDCRNEKGNCEICDDLLIYYYNDAGNCEVCDVSVCTECSKETEDPEKPGYVGYDVACDECIKEKKLVVTAESFAAPYAGAGSLMGIGQDTGLGSFTSKELTESSAIHGDFDSASLNYSGKQNLEVRAEASDSYDNLAHQDEMAQEAYQEYVQELDPATDYPPMSFEDWYEQTMAIYDTPEYDKYLEQQYLQMQEDEEELARQLMTLEADWRDLPRDSSGRWIKENEYDETSELEGFIDIQPGQSGTFPLPVEKEEPSLNTTNDYITIRDLASMMNKMTGGMLGFAESRNTVLEMLGENDSMERRDSLYFSIEDTIMTMENYNETGYEGDIQVMVDIMRDTGIAPPANFEEKVMARYQFEDKYAAEDKKILKPEVPADYNIQQTFGNNMILSSEDEGPTINDFFGELSKLLKKYGSIETFDSERVKEGLYFSGMILPHNGAYNFFQYDEDFGSGIIE
jgi:hypothetical protein